VLLVLILIGFIVGFYIKEQGEKMGEIIIGIDVLVVAFILMPLFLYHRYKNKDLSNFRFRGFHKIDDDNDD
jgi:hypothetical protein